MVRSARAWTLVVVVLLVLLPVLPSAVPVEATDALLESTVPSAGAAGTVTWMVNTAVLLTARVRLRLQVTFWPTALQSRSLPRSGERRAGGGGWVTVVPPEWVEDGMVVTVRL